MADYNGGGNKGGYNGPQTPRKLTHFDVKTNWLRAKPPEGAKSAPTMRFRTIGNQPRIVVKTQVPNDKDYGTISFNTDSPTFFSILKTILDVADGKLTDTYTFEYKTLWMGKQKLDAPATISEFIVGRDEKHGRVYVAVTARQRPRIQFFFGPSLSHGLLVNGEKADPKLLSEVYAKGFVEYIGPIVQQMMVDEFDETKNDVAKPPGENGFNNNGGGNNYQRGNGGGGNNYQRSNGGGNSGGGGNGGSYGNPSPSSDIDDFDDSF